MSHLPKTIHAFSKLLSYPDQHTAQTAELLYVVLQSEIPEAASDMSLFGAFLEQHEFWQVEEAFTGTFDVNPSCALEVGWHLFGEEYARGMFLVRMREEMRKYGVLESRELPDHISHVLSVVAAMPEHEAARLVRACLQPAAEKMDEALSKADTPYRHVISCLVTMLARRWGAGSSGADKSILDSRAPESDPLHAFPVAQAECSGCGGSCDEAPVVSLNANTRRSQDETTPSTREAGDE